MANISGVLGTAGGAQGTGYSGPQQANILNPVNQQMGLDALTQQQAFVNAMNPGGLQALQSQQNLMGQLEQQSQGNGPNPALAQLNQTTGQNVANQAALMAGQRGSNANVGMMARQAGQQGAATQQQAVGQAATLNAQQQLAARQQLAQQQQAMIGQQSSGNQQYAGNVLNQINAQNNANVGMQSDINKVNAGLISGVTGQQEAVGGGSASGGSAMMTKFAGAEGGYVQDMPQVQPQVHQQAGGPQSFAGRYLNSSPTMMAEGGTVPALVSPGEQYIPPQEVKAVAEGKKDPLQAGERIPGKPKYAGNDYRNDVVKKDLKEGGLVIPNEVMQSSNPHWEAMKFVHAHTRSLKKSK